MKPLPPADDRDFERWPRTGRPCDQYRDEHGYCHLITRCWSGKPCPRSALEALHFWNDMPPLVRTVH